MRKTIFGGISALAIAAIAVWNVNLSSNEKPLSLIALANVEALATPENNGQGSSCTIEWAAKVGNNVVKMSCSATCAAGQLAQCKQNDCKCVQQM